MRLIIEKIFGSVHPDTGSVEAASISFKFPVSLGCERSDVTREQFDNAFITMPTSFAA